MVWPYFLPSERAALSQVWLHAYSCNCILSCVSSDSGNSQPSIWHCELSCLSHTSSLLHTSFVEKLGEFTTWRWTAGRFAWSVAHNKDHLSPLHIGSTDTPGPAARSCPPWALREFLLSLSSFQNSKYHLFLCKGKFFQSLWQLLKTYNPVTSFGNVTSSIIILREELFFKLFLR